MSTENKIQGKVRIIGYLLIAGFSIILVRLWQLQVIQGSAFRKISESNRLRVIGVPAPRGIIFDRNGIPLVKNVPYFCASIIPAEFTRPLGADRLRSRDRNTQGAVDDQLRAHAKRP